MEAAVYEVGHRVHHECGREEKGRTAAEGIWKDDEFRAAPPQRGTDESRAQLVDDVRNPTGFRALQPRSSDEAQKGWVGRDRESVKGGAHAIHIRQDEPVLVLAGV